jgi:hypothetical protein
MRDRAPGGLIQEETVHVVRSPLRVAVVAALVTTAFTASDRAFAQVTTGAPLPSVPRPQPSQVSQRYDAAELDRILSPIALYPDPLLAQLLTAATFSAQLPLAAQWRERRPELAGEALTAALGAEPVGWDPSVQAMLAFPTVLEMMAANMPWTEEIGDAFARQPEDVMDAVQRLRAESHRHGYLRSNDDLQVTTGETIEILPVNPTYIVVPHYDPLIVYVAPRPRFVVGSAIFFGYGVRLGHWFEPWGRGPGGFHWTNRRIVYGYPGWGRPWNGWSRGYGRSVFYTPRYASRADARGSWSRDGWSRDGWSRDGAARGSDRRGGTVDWSRDGYDRDDASGRGERGNREATGANDRASRGVGTTRPVGPVDWSRDRRGAPAEGGMDVARPGATRDARRGSATDDRRSAPDGWSRGESRGGESLRGESATRDGSGSARSGNVGIVAPRSGRPAAPSRASGSARGSTSPRATPRGSSGGRSNPSTSRGGRGR